MTIEPSARTPTYQLLADDLRAQITSGRLRPGQRLPTEPELCARSGVSRSTVREALRLLSSQHLIVTTRGVTGGSFVARPSPAQLAATLADGIQLLLATSSAGLDELMEVREMLEVPAVGLVARRRTDSDLACLRDALFDPMDGDVSAKMSAHRRFHGAIAAATGNPLYELITRPLYDISNDGDLADRAPLRLWRQIDIDHREILRCIEASDAAGAQRATAVHVSNLRRDWPREVIPAHRATG